MKSLQEMSKTELLVMYEATPNVRRMAMLLGVSDRTLRRKMDEVGIKRKLGRPKGKEDTLPREKTAILASYIREHPNEVLPASAKEIAEKVGCSVDQVKTYLYRRRKEVARKVDRLGDPRGWKMLLKDTIGGIVPTGIIESYVYEFSKTRLKVRLKVRIRGGKELICLLPPSLIDHILKTRVPAETPNPPSVEPPSP